MNTRFEAAGTLAALAAVALAGCGTSGANGAAVVVGNGDGGTVILIDGGLGTDAGFVFLSDGGVGTDGGTVADGGTGTADFEVTRTDLVTDTGANGTKKDPNLVNPWGIASSATGPFWISDNGKGVSTLYDGNGTPQSLIVTIPAPSGSAAGTTSAPTGVVQNPTGSFDHDLFIFATEDGTIAGAQTGPKAVIRVDNSKRGAVYKGIAIVGDTLFATNFASGKIDTFDTNYASKISFTDSTVPAGFAPFGIAAINNDLYVSFAKQDAQKHDDVAGPGNGFIDVFSTQGALVRRLVSNGPLDSPWGMVLAPNDLSGVGGMLLVGNFGTGDNHINVFDPSTGDFLGSLQENGHALQIDGLWGLAFGNDGTAGPHDTLFFTAGPGNEQHGVFGKIEFSSP